MRKTMKIVPMLLAITYGIAMAGGGLEPKARETGRTWSEPTPADPAAAQKALDEARRAVTPPPSTPAPAPAPQPRPQTIKTPETSRETVKSGWMLKDRSGKCTTTDRLQQNVGPFSTPQEFGQKMKQRGFRPFILDIGDGQVKVKVPDQDLDLLFVESSRCP